MAETIISPGVFQRENDISFIAPAPVAAGACILGPAVKGPVEVPTVVTSYNEYKNVFGETFESGSTKQEFLTSVAVKSYFSQGGGSVLVGRVVSGSFTRATSTDSTNAGTTTGLTFASGSGTLAAAAVDNQEFALVYGSDTYKIVAADNPLPDDSIAGKYYFFSTGSDATGTADNLRDKINNTAALSAIVSASSDTGVLNLSGSAEGTAYNGITFLTGSTAGATADYTLITLEGGTNTVTATTNAFTLETLGKGAIYNNSTGASDGGSENSDGSLVSGSGDNLRWEISNIDNEIGTFTLSIRRGDDSRKNKVILETFNGCSLDPNSPNYIASVIGDQYTQISSDGTQVESFGEYTNKSKYVRVSAVSIQTLNYLGTDGVTVGTDSAGNSYSGSLPVAQSGSFYGGTGNIVQGGDNYFKDIDGTDSQGLVGGNYDKLITLLGNVDDYQFNIVSVPGLNKTDHSSTVDSVISLAETRGDCIAVVDMDGYGSTVSTVTTKAKALNSSYAATYWPWLQTVSGTGKNVWMPASAVIPGIYAFTDGASAPWFAPAGLTRGGVPGVIQAERKLSKSDRDTLYSGKVNPIATFPGSGITVFGQKTLQTKSSALDRVNVRRLLIDLKKFIGDQSKNLVFEQNTVATRNRFLAAVNPYLESVTQRQGLYAYRVVMDDTNNTADVIDRNQLVGQIFIQPAKTAEFIVLDFVVEPTGASFGG